MRGVRDIESGGGGNGIVLGGDAAVEEGRTGCGKGMNWGKDACTCSSTMSADGFP